MLVRLIDRGKIESSVGRLPLHVGRDIALDPWDSMG